MGADKSIITVDVVKSDVVLAATLATRKGGTIVITGLSDPTKVSIELPSSLLTLFEKRIQGSLFGSGDPFRDIPRLVDMYRAGKLKIDEMITRTYTLDEINQGYADLLEGRNIRGVITFDTAPLEGAPA